MVEMLNSPLHGDLPVPSPTQNVELAVIFEKFSSDLKHVPSSTTGSDADIGTSEVVPLPVIPHPFHWKI